MLFNLGDQDLSEIPDGFPVGSNNYRMSTTKVEMVKPKARDEEDYPELAEYRRSLKIELQVSDDSDPLYETPLYKTLTSYDFSSNPGAYKDLSREAQLRIRDDLKWFKRFMRQLGFSNTEINDGLISTDDLMNLDLMVQVIRRSDADEFPNFNAKPYALVQAEMADIGEL